jgi:chromosome segregation ATPase
MPGSIRVLIVLTALAPGPVAGADLGAQSADQPALKEMINQLRKLRLELLEQRVENQEGNILQLERELQQVGADQQRLEQQEREQAEALAQLEQRLSEAQLTPEDRHELEATTRAAVIARGDRGAARSSLDQRRAQVQQQLEQARQQRQKLLEKARQLSVEIGEIREAGKKDPRGSLRLARESEADVKR